MSGLRPSHQGQEKAEDEKFTHKQMLVRNEACGTNKSGGRLYQTPNLVCVQYSMKPLLGVSALVALNFDAPPHGDAGCAVVTRVGGFSNFDEPQGAKSLVVFS
jgi:hypothetical protein